MNRQGKFRNNSPDSLLAYEIEYDIDPDSVSQNILMESIIKSGAEDAPERVMSILNRMESDFRNGNKAMKPDQCSFRTVIHAFVCRGRANAAKVAEGRLSRAWDNHQNHGGNAPDVDLYNSVVNAYSTLEASESLPLVKAILMEMENEEQSNVPRPGKYTANYGGICKRTSVIESHESLLSSFSQIWIFHGRPCYIQHCNQIYARLS